MANLPLSPLSKRNARWPIPELRSALAAQLEAFPQLRLPAVRWAVGALAVVLLLGMATAFFAMYLMFAPLQLPEPIDGSRAATTQIFGADGSVIEQWHGPINRTFVALDDMSEHLKDAAIAAEDARFYRRGAVDLRAVMRAAGANLVSGAMVQGGSTIGQQYAKNVYVGNDRSLSRKIREARVAYRLERELGKDRVLEGYLNTVYFGRGAYGVEAASKVYFGKPASDLTLSESALLISLIPSPNAYSPYRYPDRSEARRGWVLERMEKVGFIDRRQARDATRQEPALNPAATAHPRYGWFLDALRTYLLRKYGSEKVYSGGLKVQTTLDPQAQEAAEATLAGTLPEPHDPYAAMVSIDPNSGYVKALVGGRQYSDERYNIALQGRRQPGSAFKPLVLAAALESGIPPSAGYRAPGRLCLKAWKPNCVSNFGGSGYGYLNLEQATINSVNTVYAQLILDVGPKKVAEVARRMGIPGPEWMPPRSGCRKSAGDSCRTELQPVAAMALGAEEVTPLELASAYATLAAGGVYREPKFVSKVVDSKGRVLEEGPSPGKQAISPRVAQTVNEMLSKVITQGTGTRANFGRPAAGKTGTAQDFSNAWFAGYTPYLATAVWMGHRDGNQPLVNVHGVRNVAGGTLPAEMWREYMKGVSDRMPPTIELGEAPTNGASSPDRDLQFEGRAVDSDGLVQGVEVSIDGGPFTSAGVECDRCPGPEVTWSYRSPTYLQDGEHVVAVRSYDKPGHRSEPQERRFTVDTTPPALRKVAAAGGRAALSVEFSEPVACASATPNAFAVLVTGQRARTATVACTGQSSAAMELTLARTVRGGNQITVDLGRTSRNPVDQAGNRASGHGVRITATNSLPLVEPAPVPSERFTAEEVEITGSAVDPDGTLEGLAVSVDGGPFSAAGLSCRRCGRDSTSEWEYRPPAALSHGKHTLAFRSSDNAAALSKVRVRKVEVDAVPPSVDAVTAKGGNAAIEIGFIEPVACAGINPGAFEVTSEGRRMRVATVACSGRSAQVIELGVSEPIRGGARIVLSTRGHTGAPADEAGNPSPSQNRSIQATNLDPILELEPAPGLPAVSAGGVRAAGRTIDPDGIVDGIEASVDGAAFTSAGVQCTGCGRAAEAAWTYTPKSDLANGKHTLAFRSIDNAGRHSAAASRAVTVDSVAPALSQVRAAGGSGRVEVFFSEPVTCSANPSALFRTSVGGRSAQITGLACNGSSAALTLSRVPEGGARVDVGLRSTSRGRPGVTDTAGNPALSARVSTTATNRPPVISITTPGLELAGRMAEPEPGPMRIEGTASDPDGVVEAVEMSVDKAPYSGRGIRCRECGRAGQVSFSIELAQGAVPGERAVAVRARDSASAFSASATPAEADDAQAPALKGISAAARSSTVIARFSEPLDCATVDPADFAVRVGRTRRQVLSATCSGQGPDGITLRLTGRLQASGSVSVEVNGTVQDLAGNLVSPGSAKTTAIQTDN